MMPIVGFAGFGWTSSKAAEIVANNRANNAVTDVLVPICLEKAKADPGYTENIKLLEAEDHWKRGQQVSDFGWATFHDGGKPNGSVADQCATKLFTEEQ